MRIAHLGDLHIGKKLNGMSLLEDQQFILGEIIKIVKNEKVEVVVISGDIYDKSVPVAEGISLFDEFITELQSNNIKVLMVSGNHDSSERIEYGSRIFENSGVYIAGKFEGTVKKVELEDCYGKINFWLVPFIKPAIVKSYYPECNSYEDAFSWVIEGANINYDERNVLVAHQFFTSGSEPVERSDSEIISVGTLDNIDTSVIKGFDYAALGHIHKPQSFNEGKIRYSGSPLKYSFSEANHVKSVPIIELKDKGQVDIKLVLLEPLRDLRVITGPIDVLLSKDIVAQGNREDYIKAVLTDEEELYDAIGRVREVYPNVLRLEFNNSRGYVDFDYSLEASEVESKSKLELFEEFFEKQNNRAMDENERSIVRGYLEEVD